MKVDFVEVLADPVLFEGEHLGGTRVVATDERREMVMLVTGILDRRFQAVRGRAKGGGLGYAERTCILRACQSSRSGMIRARWRGRISRGLRRRRSTAEWCEYGSQNTGGRGKEAGQDAWWPCGEAQAQGWGKGSWEGLYRIVAARDEVEVAVDEEHVEWEVLDALRLYRSQALSSGGWCF